MYGIFDIDRQVYYEMHERRSLVERLTLKNVPLINWGDYSDCTTDDLLKLSDGKSDLNSKQDREGLVFRQLDGRSSFKTIGNKYLMKQKD